MDLIIDAYNLIFQCGLEGPQRTPASITRSRTRLIQLLARLLPAEQCTNTTVVFDAKRIPLKETQIDSRKHGIRVLFAVGYESADEMIEELVAAHSHPKDLLVISSDHRIQNAATRRKAKAIDSDVWLDQIESRPQRNQASAKSNANDPTQQQTPTKPVTSEIKSHDWAAEFGIDDNQASEEFIHKVEDELGISDSNDTDESQDITVVEDEFKDIDWIAEFGLDSDD